MTDADLDDFAIHWRYEVNGRDVTGAKAFSRVLYGSLDDQETG